MPSERERRRLLWPGDALLATVEILDGVPDGVSCSFAPTGEQRQECHFHAGKLHGDYRCWWDNGHLKEQGQYGAGNRVGRYEWLDRDGSVIRTVGYPPAAPELPDSKRPT
jgi:antitoxin component YwqK of YwqJK toxin-antitoxin module